ncbi:MAG: amidophosphoribosyltransferase [Dethiosulfovibrio peptidovorans]|nr:MAG: amidophosphoribosyltransferase [Dethiosulfovibrio peptidovorans]
MCGVFGAFSLSGRPVLEEVYLGLYALQHRGQESAGVAWIDGNDQIRTRKGQGLVHLALNQADLATIPARSAIGHVRYSTTGGGRTANVQPLAANYCRGPVAIAHNGNLSNASRVRQYLENRGAIFQSTTDTEVVLHLMAHQPHKPELDALADSLKKLKGAYSLAVALKNRLVAARDPWGFRPLALGQRDDVYYVSSESCALDLVGASMIRELEPGEILVVDDQGLRSLRIPVTPKRRFLCSFEFVYFARPDSVLSGRSVYQVRKEMGRLLARRSPCNGNCVACMPDSGTVAAMGYAQESGIPYEKAIVRNRYSGRTFIEPTQRVRELGVRKKLNPVREVIQGQTLAVVDDSIVRGTTSRRMVELLLNYGAQGVHVRVSSPPVRFPCYYGIDTPTREELAAARSDEATLCAEIGAKSLAYLTEADLLQAIGLPDREVCTACFSGNYMEDGEDYEELDI